MKREILKMKSAQRKAYSFFAFISMAEACVLPYLTVYLKHLGISATHVGILRSIQSFLAIWTLILWVHFATRFNAHRLVIVTSLLVSIAGFLCVTLLPPLDTSAYLIRCPYSENNQIGKNVTGDVTRILLVTESNKAEVQYSTPLTNEFVKSAPKYGDFNSYDKYRSNNEYSENEGDGASLSDQYDYARKSEPLKPYVPDERIHDIAENRHNYAEDGEMDYANSNANSYYDDEGSFPFKRSISKIRSRRNIFSSVWSKIYPNYQTTAPTTPTIVYRVRKTTTKLPTPPMQAAMKPFIKYGENLTEPNVIAPIEDHFNPDRLSYLFLFIAFMLGWIFGTPALTVADQAWYGFLDDMDLTEKYGRHRAYCLFLAATLSLVTSLAIGLTNCRLWFDIDHFNIHFYVYAILMIITLLFASCFPVVTSKFSLALPQTTKNGEFRLLFSDLSMTIVTLTALLIGALNAFIQDFLLWTVEELGGNEFHLGTIVCLNFLVEIWAPDVSRYLLRKLKLHPVLFLSLTTLSLRMLVFSFMMLPWLAVGGQLIHLLSAALMPAITNAYLGRTSDHSSYRAIRTVVVPCLEMAGHAVGSIGAGVLYDYFGSHLMFQVAAGISFVWGVFVYVVYKVRLGDRKAYVKLIHVQEGADTGVVADSETDEDWLDGATKKPYLSPSSA